MGILKIEAIYPLSPSQQGMLLESLAFPDSGKQVEQLLWQWQGTLNVAAYERAWQRVLARHTILRTGFLWKDQAEPLQFVLRQAKMPLERLDWRGYSEAEQAQQLEEFLAADRHQGFNLTKVPLMHLSLIQLAADSYQLAWRIHHILLDGWGLPIITGEVMDFYEAECAGRRLRLPPTRPYGDYIAWLQQQDQSAAEAFWRERLRGITQPTPIATIADAKPTESFGEYRLTVPGTILDQMQSLARQQRVTLNTLMQATWALLLSRYSGERDVVFGITVSGRLAEIENIESMVGLFINTVPLRVQLNPEISVGTWLQTLQAQTLEQHAYEYCSAGQIQQWSAMPPTLRLYESLLVFENYPLEEADASAQDGQAAKDYTLTDIYSLGAQTQYPLTITAFPHEALYLKFVYHRASFNEAHIERLAQHGQGLLTALVSSGEQSLASLLAHLPDEQIPVVIPAQIQLKPVDTATFVPPLNEIQQQLVQIWQEIFEVPTVGVTDNFYDLGGYSMLAIRLVGQIRARFGLNLPISALLLNPSIAELSQLIEERAKAEARSPAKTDSAFSTVVPIQPNGDKPPFFLAPGGGGTVFYMYYLTRYMEPDQPLYGLQAAGLDGQSEPHTSVEAMADYFLAAIKEIQPHGPYFLGGHSFGIFIAYEMAQRLLKAGETVATLINLDTQAHHLVNKLTHDTTAAWIDEYVITFEEVFADKITQPYERLVRVDGAAELAEDELWAHFAKWLRANKLMASNAEIEAARRRLDIFRLQLTMDYQPRDVMPMPMTIFRATEWENDQRPEKMGWDALDVETEIHLVPGNHMSFIGEPHIQVVAEKLSACLQAAQANFQPPSK